MFSKIKLISISILFFYFLFINTSGAKANNNQLDLLISQVKTLQKEIQSLQKMISLFKLQKTITADAYLVVNLNNQSIILEKNKEKQYPIASLTKLMNAVIVKENLDLNQTISLTKEMLEPEGYSPSLFLGLKINARNLLQASLIQSTNDAANALSYFLGKEKFLELMNQKTKDLQMENTLFIDVYGLNPGNHSNAEDLVKLLNYIYQYHSEILKITKNNDFWLPNQAGRWLKFKNLNIFYKMPEFIGGKTGYTPEAKETLAAIFNINNEPIAIVLLFSQNQQGDALKILNWLKFTE
ncbi:MAG: D-alanyl-D-alanine carboxypeptidase family protein [Minisyncoccales bacterium]